MRRTEITCETKNAWCVVLMREGKRKYVHKQAIMKSQRNVT